MKKFLNSEGSGGVCKFGNIDEKKLFHTDQCGPRHFRQGALQLLRIPKISEGNCRVMHQRSAGAILGGWNSEIMPWWLVQGQRSAWPLYPTHCKGKSSLRTRFERIDFRVSIISNSETLVKLPDASFVKFFCIGCLIQRLFEKHPSTPLGLWKRLQEGWSTIHLNSGGKTFTSRKKSCPHFLELDGQQIESTQRIHCPYKSCTHEVFVWVNYHRTPFVVQCSCAVCNSVEV
jgi:hypothetical protein